MKHFYLCFKVSGPLCLEKTKEIVELCSFVYTIHTHTHIHLILSSEEHTEFSRYLQN